MTEKEKKVSIKRLEAFGFEEDRVAKDSFLYYYNDIEINCIYIKQSNHSRWYMDIVILFNTNLQIMFTDLFFIESVDPEAILDGVKKLAAAVEFIEL